MSTLDWTGNIMHHKHNVLTFFKYMLLQELKIYIITLTMNHTTSS